MSQILLFVLAILMLCLSTVCFLIISPQFLESWIMHNGYKKRMRDILNAADEE